MQSLITSPIPQRSTAKVAQLALLPDGSVAALSSNGVDLYRVQLSPVVSCTCPAGRHGRVCYHSVQAVERFGSPTEFETDPEADERAASAAMVEAADLARWERQQAVASFFEDAPDCDYPPFE
jgi:uncharacterized Zn finger protein